MRYSLQDACEGEIPQMLALEERAAVRFSELVQRDVKFAALVVPEDLTPQEELRRAVVQGLCWLARWDAEPVGFVYASWVGEDLFIEELDVVPEYGRRGIGSALLAQVEHRARAFGARALALTTFSGVPWNAPWYRRLGFVEQEPGSASSDLRAVWHAEEERGFKMHQRSLMLRQISN